MDSAIQPSNNSLQIRVLAGLLRFLIRYLYLNFFGNGLSMNDTFTCTQSAAPFSKPFVDFYTAWR